MTLLARYTSLSDVRRELRAVPPRGRIKFSESYTTLKKHNDNTGTIELSRIGISNEYSDTAAYRFTFGADSTSFTMYRADDDKQSNFIVGTGMKQNNFTSDDGNFTVDSTNWLGWSFPADNIEFITDSHISINDGTRFIMDAEYFVDSVVEKNIRFNSTSEDSLRFPLDSTSSVPKAIQLATQKIAAYMIYKAIYLETHAEGDEQKLSSSMLRQGLELIGNYVAKWDKALSTSAPVIGHGGSNEPVDLNNDHVFKGSAFNLRIPNFLDVSTNNTTVGDSRAQEFASSTNFAESILADISMLE